METGVNEQVQEHVPTHLHQVDERTLYLAINPNATKPQEIVIPLDHHHMVAAALRLQYPVFTFSL